MVVVEIKTPKKYINHEKPDIASLSIHVTKLHGCSQSSTIWVQASAQFNYPYISLLELLKASSETGFPFVRSC